MSQRGSPSDEPPRGSSGPLAAVWSVFGRRRAAPVAAPEVIANPGLPPAVVEFLRLLRDLEREIAALPEEHPQTIELLWAMCAKLASAGQVADAVFLWSKLRAASARHCPAAAPIAVTALAWLVREDGNVPPSRATLAHLLAVEALDAVAEDPAAQERLLLPLAPLAEAPPPTRVLDALLQLRPLLPRHAAEHLQALRLHVASGSDRAQAEKIDE